MPMPPLHGSYRDLDSDCRKFLQLHPSYERNVFIMTRFLPGDELLEELDQELRRALCRRGLNGVRADDRMFPIDRQLWKNVCVYMLCCASGVAILEDRLADEFNPNVALEYGFMRALDKPTLLLKDKLFRNQRADIMGTVHGEFNLGALAKTLPPAIDQWVRDLDLALEPGPSQLEQLAFGIYARLLNIRAAAYLRDPARRKRELDDEFHYLGVDNVSVYEQALAQHPDAEHAAALAEARSRVLEQHDTSAIPALVERFAALSRRRA
jgi:hypothetical protein